MIIKPKSAEKSSRLILKQPANSRLRRAGCNSAKIYSFNPLSLRAKTSSSSKRFNLKLPETCSAERQNHGKLMIVDEDIPTNYAKNGVEFNPSASNFETPQAALPPLPDLEDPIFPVALRAKIKLCNFICNFYKNDAEQEAIKKSKSIALEEINSVLATTAAPSFINDQILTEIALMCKNNIIRRLPYINSYQILYIGLSSAPDPAWPHLNFCYLILRRLVTSFGGLTILDENYMISLIPLLSSPDENERAAIQFIIQSYMRICNPNSANLILNKLAQMIDLRLDGDASPFCVGHILFLIINALQGVLHMNSPLGIWSIYAQRLLSDPHLSRFERQFRNFTEYLFDEIQGFSSQFVRALILRWPCCNADKEACFVKLLNDTVPRLPAREFNNLSPRILYIYANCTVSQSENVAEAALSIWTIVGLEPLLKDSSKPEIQKLYYAVSAAQRGHWSQKVRESAASAMKSMSRSSPKLTQEAFANGRYSLNDPMTRSAKHINPSQNPNPDNYPIQHNDMRKWATIARAAARNDNSINLGNKLADITMLYNDKQRRQVQMQMMMGYSQMSVSVRQSHLKPLIP